MKTYNKLVRDRVPETIAAVGQRCEVRVLGPTEYAESLKQKLDEETEEYCQTGDITELADVMEVVCAIIEQKGMRWEEFERIRIAKRQERGAFAKRLLLVSVLN